jgi:hypothetical protein
LEARSGYGAALNASLSGARERTFTYVEYVISGVLRWSCGCSFEECSSVVVQSSVDGSSVSRESVDGNPVVHGLGRGVPRVREGSDVATELRAALAARLLARNVAPALQLLESRPDGRQALTGALVVAETGREITDGLAPAVFVRHEVHEDPDRPIAQTAIAEPVVGNAGEAALLERQAVADDAARGVGRAAFVDPDRCR